MKYKVGDKFEIEVIAEGKFAKDYYVTTVGIVNEEALNRLKKVEPKESEVDWSKVDVDTPILVSTDKINWYRRYFATYRDGLVYAWQEGTTSWSADSKNALVGWCYAKLTEVEE